jgi:hypothetical protein
MKETEKCRKTAFLSKNIFVLAVFNIKRPRNMTTKYTKITKYE